MLGAAGMIIPEMLAAGGLIPQTSDEVAWFKTGVIPPAGNYGRFWADPYALFFIEVIAFQFAELRRWQDYKKPGSMGKQYFLGLEKVLGGSGNPSYPGTPLSRLHQCTPFAEGCLLQKSMQHVHAPGLVDHVGCVYEFI